MKNIKLKLLLLFATLILGKLPLKAQVIPPYYTGFDYPFDTVGWTFHAINGNSDWEIDTLDLAFNYNTPPPSLPSAIGTVLNGWRSPNNESTTETPYFDLSDTTSNYVLSFRYFIHRPVQDTLTVEFSLDSGLSWSRLTDSANQSYNWSGGYIYYGFWQRASLNISYLQGHPSVKFRFRYDSNIFFASYRGFVMDDFRIEEDKLNVIAVPGDSIFTTPNCPSIDVAYPRYFGFAD